MTDSQKECVDIMRKDMERGQMLIFIHGPPGSGKTTTARLLVSEKNFDPVFSGLRSRRLLCALRKLVHYPWLCKRNERDIRERCLGS